MRTIKRIIVSGLILLFIVAGWQVSSHELANFQLQDDLHDLASQLGARIGFNAPRSDDDYRLLVVRKAGEHGIELKPDQVTVHRGEHGEAAAGVYLAAEYDAPVKLPGYAFVLHFTASSTKKSLF